MILVDLQIEIQIPETDKVIYVGCLKEMVAVEMSDFVENGAYLDQNDGVSLSVSGMLCINFESPQEVLSNYGVDH